MRRDEYVEANRKMWNERAGIHAERHGGSLAERVQAADFSTFDEVERRLFAALDLHDKAVIQLCCNNGRELISVKKAGAGRCVGVDLSDVCIHQAGELASLAKVEIEFVQASVYDLPPEYAGQYDLAYITIGALGWLPDMDAFFEVVARLLKPNGQVFIYEMHPILNMFEAEQGLTIQTSYFQREPFEVVGEADYLDPSRRVNSTSYWFPHKLSDIISGCLKQRFCLTHFEEYAHDKSLEYAAFEHMARKPPLSFSLVARKCASLGDRYSTTIGCA